MTKQTFSFLVFDLWQDTEPAPSKRRFNSAIISLKGNTHEVSERLVTSLFTCWLTYQLSWQRTKECLSPGPSKWSSNQRACRPMTTSTPPALNAVMSFLPSPTNMEINMEPLDSFNTFAMDDPSTPLCSNSSSSPFSLYRSAPNRCPFAPTVPVCSSFDQEFQLQDNNYINMLPHNITLKSGGLAEEESPAYALHQSSEHIEFPLDLFDYLENVPFNIEQLVDQDIYRNVLCDAGSCQADTRRAPNSEVPCDQLVTPTIELVQPQQEMVEIKSENVDINMEEIYSFSPIPPYQENVPPPPPSLYLNISQTTSQTENEVSTPVIIKMLLESAEEIGQKVINSFACITFSLTFSFPR